MKHEDLITQFYTAFSSKNLQKILNCYHEEIIFSDPAFGTLNGDRARGMWAMLLAQKNSELNIRFDQVSANGETGMAYWIAQYVFGPSKRKVTNRVTARFKFKDGFIVEHRDSFDLRCWSRQAMGLSGLLLGWTSFMKNKVQRTTNGRLNAFMSKCHGTESTGPE